MITSVLLAILLAGGASLFLRQPKFGKPPRGARLQKIRQSPNFRHGAFHNQSPTPDLSEGATYFTVIKKFLFTKNKRAPKGTIPSTFTDLHGADLHENFLVWFGHSSYYMQVHGKRFLVDPVLSGAASPLSFTTRAFAGTQRYKTADIPHIDYLLITHDHWDHLDYATIRGIRDKVGKVICPLGVGQHLESWGIPADDLIEKDWNEMTDLEDGIKVFFLPARHFSGRGLKRNRSLWASYVLQTPSHTVFIGGDSGYDGHFMEAGKRFGPFDLAILENGQYDVHWRYIHLLPDEFVKAAKDLRAKRVLPVHSGKFALGNHPWDEPLQRAWENGLRENLHLITPMIGEKVDLDSPHEMFSAWWKGVD